MDNVRRTPSKGRRKGPSPQSASKEDQILPPLFYQKQFTLGGAKYTGTVIRVRPRLKEILVGFPNQNGVLDSTAYNFLTIGSFNRGDMRDADKYAINPTFKDWINKTPMTPASQALLSFDEDEAPTNQQIVFPPGVANVPFDPEWVNDVHGDSSAIFIQKETAALRVASTMNIMDRFGIPTIAVTVQSPRKFTCHDGLTWVARFTSASSGEMDVRSTLKHATLYSVLVRLKVSGMLAWALRPFGNRELFELALGAEPYGRNIAHCLDTYQEKNSSQTNPWLLIKVEQAHVYSYVNKTNNIYMRRMFSPDDKALFVENRTRLARERRRVSVTTTTTEKQTKQRAYALAQTATLRGNMLNTNVETESSGGGGGRSVKHDATFCEEDLALLLGGGSGSGGTKQAGMIRTLQKQVNAKTPNEYMERAGVCVADRGLDVHLAYYLARTIVAPNIKLDMREDQQERQRSRGSALDTMVRSLLATADPISTLQESACDPLKVFLVTLVLSRFDPSTADAAKETDTAAKKEGDKKRGTFKSDRKKDHIGFGKKAEKILTVMQIIFNQLDPTNQHGGAMNGGRTTMSLKLGLDPTCGGVSNETMTFFNQCGLVVNPIELTNTMTQLANHLTLHWLWEEPYHTDPDTGVYTNDGSHCAWTAHCDNVDSRGGKGSGRQFSMLGIGGTKFGTRRWTKQEMKKMDEGVKSRANEDDGSNTTTPRANDWKLMLMTPCEQKKKRLHDVRRMLLCLRAAGASVVAPQPSNESKTNDKFYKQGDQVDLILPGTNHRVEGVIQQWNGTVYIATYSLGRIRPEQSSFKPSRVKPRRGTKERPAAVESKVDLVDETISNADLIFNEPRCDPAETVVAKVCMEVSSKHRRATELMQREARETFMRSGFLKEDDIMWMVEDFEFFKSLMENYHLNHEYLTIPVPAAGHLAKALAVQILTYFESIATRPLMCASGMVYMDNKYKTMLKGTHIMNTIKQALLQGVVALVSLGKFFLEEKGDLIVTSNVTVYQYLTDPTILDCDQTTTTTGYVLGLDGRPELVPMDHNGELVVALFEEFVAEKMSTEGGGAGAAAAGGAATGGDNSGGDDSNPSSTPHASVTPLEVQLLYTLSAVEVRKRCEKHARECETFEWLEFKKNQGVLRARLVVFESNGADDAAAEKSNAVSAAMVKEEIEGPAVPAGANLNLRVLWHMIRDTANLSLLQLSTRVMEDPPPKIRVNKAGCRCDYAHDRCYCEFTWWVAIKAVLGSVFAHRQYNYQLSLIYFALEVIGFTSNDDTPFVALMMETITACFASSPSGYALRCSPVDMLQETNVVLRVKQMFRRDRSERHLTEMRAILHSVKTVLTKRAAIKAAVASGAPVQPVSTAKSTLWKKEGTIYKKELDAMDVIVKDMLTNMLAVVAGTRDVNFVEDTMLLWNLEYTAWRQQCRAMQHICRALEHGLLVSLPNDRRVPPRSSSKLPPTKDKRKAAERKAKDRAKQEQLHRLVALEVASNKCVVVPDDYTMLDESPASSNKASLVMELLRRLVEGAQNGHVIVQHAVDMLHMFTQRTEMYQFLHSIDIGATGAQQSLSQARRAGGGVIKVVDILQELQLRPGDRRPNNDYIVPHTFREVARGFLVGVANRHFRGRGTQGVIVNMDTAMYMTELRKIVQEKRGKEQELRMLQEAMYSECNPDSVFDTYGSFSKQMKSKFGFVPYFAKLIALEMVHIDPTSGWDFHAVIAKAAGTSYGFVVFCGGGDVVQVATGASSGGDQENTLITLFPRITISERDLLALGKDIPKQAEGERMNTAWVWRLYLYSVTQLRSNQKLYAHFLIVSNDADTIDAHAFPLVIALHTLNAQYLHSDQIHLRVLLEVKPKSTAALQKTGLLWAAKERQRQHMEDEGVNANGGHGGATKANVESDGRAEVEAVPSGRKMYTVVDLVAMFWAMETFTLLPAYALAGTPRDTAYIVGSGRRAVSMSSGIFLVSGSDYITRMYKCSFNNLLNTLVSEEYCTYVSQVTALGLDATLFYIAAPLGFDAQQSLRNLFDAEVAFDPHGELAPTFVANLYARNLLHFAWAALQRRTLRHLKQVYGEECMDKLNPHINMDIVLTCAKVGRERVIPLGESGLLTRRAEENAVQAQFGTWQFLAFPGENDEPMKMSPFYYDVNGHVQRRSRPDPRQGAATDTTPEARAIAHFGASIYGAAVLPDELARLFPFRDVREVIDACMKCSSGMEPPRTVDVDGVHPKRAATTVAEVKAFNTRTGKFDDIAADFKLFEDVAKNSVVTATSYQRIGTKTTVMSIVLDKKNRKYSKELGLIIMPEAVFNKIKGGLNMTERVEILKCLTFTVVLKNAHDSKIDGFNDLFVIQYVAVRSR